MCAALAACTSNERPRPLRLGTTYTVEQSGALALLDSLPTPLPVAVVIGPSGQILQAAARGDVDVAITHAPSLEQRLLVAPGHAALRCPFVASRFAIVGPAEDPAHVAAAPAAAEAFRRIAAAGAPFVSRGDSSGTHMKELALWQAAGTSPAHRAWYVESGADQQTTLRIADERDAYALADLPSFARLRDARLKVLLAADTALSNPYTLYVTAVAAAQQAAAQFATWAVAVWRPRLLALRLPDGTPAFARRPGGCSKPPDGRLGGKVIPMGDLTPKASIWIERQGVAVIGTREASLLEAIERVHSIKEAAREAGISYRTAWGTVQAMEHALGRPVVHSRAGGPGGGSTTLTDEARDLLRVYDTVRRRLQAQAQREFQTLSGPP